MSAETLLPIEAIAIDAVKRQLETLLSDGSLKRNETARVAVTECVELIDSLDTVREHMRSLAHVQGTSLPQEHRPHPTQAVVYERTACAVDIDVNLVRLIKSLWACGIETAHSCQGDDVQQAYIMLLGGHNIDRFIDAINSCSTTKLFVTWPAVASDWQQLASRPRHSVAELTEMMRFALHFRVRVSGYNAFAGDRIGVDGAFHFDPRAIPELERVFAIYAAQQTLASAQVRTLRRRKRPQPPQ